MLGIIGSQHYNYHFATCRVCVNTPLIPEEVREEGWTNTLKIPTSKRRETVRVVVRKEFFFHTLMFLRVSSCLESPVETVSLVSLFKERRASCDRLPS